MSIFKRSILYVTRKKGKSTLLFLVLLIMATFVLTGLSIEKSTKIEQQKLRESLGGELTVMVDYTANNPYFKKTNDGDGGYYLYSERPLTQEVLDTISKVKGIKKYDAFTPTLVNTNLDVIPGNVPMKDRYSKLVYARTVSSSENNSYFESGTMKLVEGNHITPTTNGSALISKDLAEKNKLKLGDTITIQHSENKQNVDVKIIGIYEILKQDSPIKNIVTYDKLENQIFVNLDTLQKLNKNMPTGFIQATFEVNDPAELDKIISDIKGISSIDWRAFKVSTDNQDYLDAAAPLQKLQTLVTSIIIVIAIVSAVILALILTMWGRTRIHETGVLLSLGIGKIKIVSQYLTEVLIIAVLAFGFSYFTSNAIANNLANNILEQNSTVSKETGTNDIDAKVKEGYGDDISISIKDKNKTNNTSKQENVDKINNSVEQSESSQISVNIDFYNILQLYVIGFIIITISVVISSLTVMRLNPREILSKMS